MKLTELFKINPNIIINTDIDGILSGIFLCHYCGCKVAGFSNSKETVWLREDVESVYSPVYIDMFVPRQDVWCIDQHIVSVSHTHHGKFISYGTKISPQLDRCRIFEKKDYIYKYPFGSIHYIIAMLEKEGIKIELPDLCKMVDTNLDIRLGDLLMRADDAMKTTLNSNYMKNAGDWWSWLLSESNNADSINQMADFLYKRTKPHLVDNIKNNTKQYFNTHFKSRTSDGGFNNITDIDNRLLPNIKNYIDEIGGIFGMPMEYPEQYIPHKGIYKLLYWSPEWEKEFIENNTINGEKVFSYAFIYSPGGKYQNFSFTVNMED